MHSINFFSPFVVGVISVLTVFIGVFLPKKIAKVFAVVVTLAVILFSFLPSLSMFYNSLNEEALQFTVIIGLICQFILTIAVVSSIIIFANDERESITRFESYPLIGLGFSGALITIFSSNMLGTYLGIELMSLAGYIIASLNRDKKISNESSMKYFLMGAVSSCIMIYGISLIYGFSGGNIAMEDFYYNIIVQNQLGLIIGFLMFTFGLFFKTTTFPFHFWASDVYHGMNSSSLSFIAVVPKIVAFFVLCKLFLFRISQIDGGIAIFSQIALIFSAISMIIGAVGALRQHSLKKILAYSGIANMGFVLSIFSVNLSSVIVIYYFAVYTIINIGTFAIISALRKNTQYTGDINDLKGLHNSNPYLAFAFSVLLFSSAGIPPLAGFFIKYSVLANLIKEGSIILPIIGIISSIISSYYYLKIVKAMYFDTQSSSFATHSQNKIGTSIKMLIFISLAFNMILVLFANFIFLIV